MISDFHSRSFSYKIKGSLNSSVYNFQKFHMISYNPIVSHSFPPLPLCNPCPIFPPLITASLLSTSFTLILVTTPSSTFLFYYKLKLYHFSCTAHLSICTARLCNIGSAPVFEAGETEEVNETPRNTVLRYTRSLLSTRETGDNSRVSWLSCEH